MLMEKARQRSRFVCNPFNRRFLSGSSLGGHMRSHVVANSGESERFQVKKKLFSVTGEEEEDADQLMRDSWEFAEYGEGQSGGYGLRENPKKTSRAADSVAATPLLSRICKQCGKGFQSLKALCGHMACHSEKEKVLKDDSSWTRESNKTAMDGFSDTESDQRRQRSSRRSSLRKQQRMESVEDSPFSSLFEIDGHEQVEVARCLMLLSRDQMNRGGGYSAVESSDNNSVVETKSSSIDMRMSKGKKSGCRREESPEMKRTATEDDSDSGYFLDENTQTESESKYGNNACKRLESRKATAAKNEQGDEHLPKRSKFQCFNCNKIFNSYQALGGHRPCHRRISDHEPRYESGENSPEDDQRIRQRSSKTPPRDKKSNAKKSKVHACPFCDRVFRNGQALGGHKRSHFMNAHGDTRNRAPLMKPDQLDLNLPAPEASEDASHGRFF